MVKHKFHSTQIWQHKFQMNNIFYEANVTDLFRWNLRKGLHRCYTPLVRMTIGPGTRSKFILTCSVNTFGLIVIYLNIEMLAYSQKHTPEALSNAHND